MFSIELCVHHTRGNHKNLKNNRVSTIITTLNEEENIAKVINSVPKDIVNEIIIVDGFSTDKTVEIAKKYDVKILYDSIGKGSAIRKGIENTDCDIIVLMDGDLSHDGNEIRQFVSSIQSGYDVCFGSRFLPGGGTDDMPWYRILANKAFVKMVNFLWHVSYTDLCYGFRSIRKSAVSDIDMKSQGFTIEAELSIKIAKKKLKFVEIPSFEKRRMFGEAKLKTWSEGYKILKTILYEAVHK